jgi:phosphatidate cytidylyltransferase
MMASRIASATIGLPLLVLAVMAGTFWFSVLVAIAAAAGAYEISVMAGKWGTRNWTPVSIGLAVALVVGAHLLGEPSARWAPLALLVGISSAAAVLWMLWRPKSTGGTSSWVGTIAIALFPAGLLFHAPLLRSLDQGRDWVFLLLAATFAMDTSAFLVGRALGKRQLAPAISPSKTWEGAIGGVVGAMAVSVVTVRVLGLGMGVEAAISMGALVGTVGQIGDLVESRMKRAAGIKDSGRLVPGHGGIMDRLDSIVFNLAVVYYWVS